MSRKEEFDVVIIGGGISGLVCGCYLQKCGLKVAIVEAQEEAGGGRMTNESMRPGYVTQSCVWGDVEPLMMNPLDLELDKYGYQDIGMFSEWGNGYVYDDETSFQVNCLDPRKTVEKIKRFSERDAQKVMEISEYMNGPYDDKVSRNIKFLELFFTDAWTWENFDIFVNLVAPLFPFKDPYEITDLNGFEMLDLLYESDKLKMACMGGSIMGAIYPQHQGGAGIMAALLPLGLFFTHPKHGAHAVAHVYIRCFRALGGKLFNSSPVESIIVAGGEAKGVVLGPLAAFPGKEITAKRVVSDINPRVTFVDLVGEEHVGKRVIQQLKTNWKAESVLVTNTFALKERPHFAAEKYDPDIVHPVLGMLYTQKTFTDAIRVWGERMAGKVSEEPMLNYAFPHVDDPTQTRPGNCVANTYWEVPWAVYEKGGEKIWDDKDFKKEIMERTISIQEKYIPGFRDNILDSWVTSPLDYSRRNPNLLRGCDTAGSIAQPQMFFANRARVDGFDKGGIVTPIKYLYGAGSVGPVWSCGGNGYRAACHIAEEMGLRNQPWWKHRVFEYIQKKYIEKTYVPLKPTSVLDR